MCDSPFLKKSRIVEGDANSFNFDSMDNELGNDVRDSALRERDIRYKWVSRYSFFFFCRIWFFLNNPYQPSWIFITPPWDSSGMWKPTGWREIRVCRLGSEYSAHPAWLELGFCMGYWKVEIFIHFEFWRNLTSNSLKGTLPSSIGNLSSIQYLYEQIISRNFLFFQLFFSIWSPCSFWLDFSREL